MSRSFLKSCFQAVALSLAAICTSSVLATDEVHTDLANIFVEQLRPFLSEHCYACHNEDDMESGINLELLDPGFSDRQLFLWRDLVKQVSTKQMPPEEDEQPSSERREAFLSAAKRAIDLARSREREKNGIVRRLTVPQYRHCLQEIFGTEEDFTEALPPDGVSKDGFTNNAEMLSLSPLQMETYLTIAEQAIDATLVAEESPPTIQSFRMTLGKNCNPQPYPNKLTLGANSHLLANSDLLVEELVADKPFHFLPFEMQKSFRFIEGYQGNSTVRGWRDFNSIYHAVFGCMRGSGGYPLGKAYETIPDGLLLRPAIPSTEIFRESSTYGPRANFKIALRELPEQGIFQVRVRAAKYNDALLLSEREKVMTVENDADSIEGSFESSSAIVDLPDSGIYLVSLSALAKEPSKKAQPDLLELTINKRTFSRNITPSVTPNSERFSPFCLIRLNAGETALSATITKAELKKVRFIRVKPDSSLAARFIAFESRNPQLSVLMGLRRDCGHTQERVGACQAVSSTEAQEYVFQGAIDDYPRPFVETNNVNYLAGVREISVRNEYTSTSESPRLLIESVEFEGPYYESWPPRSHRRLMPLRRPDEGDKQYANRVLKQFLQRAYRRPATKEELRFAMENWQEGFAQSNDLQQALRDTFLVVLTSPQFLLVTERSSSPEAEPLDGYELATKLSLFLWNGPPDEKLIAFADENGLHKELQRETDRLMEDEKFSRFVEQFAYEWMSLDKLEVVETDRKKYPHLSKEMKLQLLREPVEFLKYLFAENLSIDNLVKSDFVLTNESLADYYDLEKPVTSGFDFVSVPASHRLGGVLTQAGLLAGLSDGRESNPVKRGAWFARRMIAEPPDDPPPNVPELEEIPGQDLSLRERLEKHRNQAGCVKCHEGIDPWGVVFEAYDASGLLKSAPVDASTTLPNGTKLEDLQELQQFLLHDRREQVVFSFLKHLSIYALGRDLSYNETLWLEDQSRILAMGDCKMRELVHFVVGSDMFLSK